MSRCLHCDKEEANYCETCYQALISENAKLQKLKCSIAVVNKLEELIKEDFIPKSKIEEKIEEIEIEILECEYADDDTEERKKDIEHEKTILLKHKRILQELLESKE